MFQCFVTKSFGVPLTEDVYFSRDETRTYLVGSGGKKVGWLGLVHSGGVVGLGCFLGRIGKITHRGFRVGCTPKETT